VSLAQILYPPPTAQGWKEWSFHQYQHHLALNSAILQLKGVTITPFRLWPVQQQGPDFQDWLQQHQLAHESINAVLGISGRDISALDFQDKDKSKRDAWFWVHHGMHRDAASNLGLPSVG
jgi:hypothetical protein